jgi:acyl-CoA thioesterase
MSDPGIGEQREDGVWQIPEEFAPPLHKTLGVEMGIGPNGEGVAWIEVDPEKHYGNRWAHGGIAATLTDIASGIAIARKVGDPYRSIDGTIELKINYLRKVVEGDLTATATLVHLGKRVAVTEVTCTNRGVLCAKAIATFMIRTPDPEQPVPDMPDQLPRT